MNELSSWGTTQKVILSILFGVLSLLTAPYGIEIVLGTITVSIPWCHIFPILIAMSFGWRYGLLVGMFGGALFPFLLWPEDGWANVSTALTCFFLFFMIGIARDTRYYKFISNVTLRMAIALLLYITLNFQYDYFLFNAILSLNPTFWIKETISYIPEEILYGIAFKDSVNVIAITLGADTLLRLPMVRTLMGLPTVLAMRANTFMFFATLCIPVVVWLTFLGLDTLLLRNQNALQYEHKSFALLVILANGLLVLRLLFYFSEKQFYIHQKLAVQNKELEQFAYIASHDLQEPLQTLVTVSALIKKEYAGKLDGQGDTYIGFISQSAKRMQDLVWGLLDYSRVGKSAPLKVVDCNLLLKGIIAEMSVKVKENNAIITLDHLPVVRGYEEELKQLFAHLIDNALKFKTPNITPEIRIVAKRQADHWLFSIQDNGIGIDVKDQDKIFVIFKRLHNRSEYPGIGIGLPQCKKIVALHGGNIWVESSSGQGSIFYFTIQSV